MLIVLAGLPGSGKATIAKLLARQLAALHLRVDSIEQAMRNQGIADEVMGAAGYADAVRAHEQTPQTPKAAASPE